ncbi:leader peptidase (prepilin peptidase) / N-methyltransferase [Geodermatophilus saharensis]|uniref:Leader peptidase (Prepilin peptidase) / N-methyltransferase n=1 Tax=Geodermatophilus saharensis TaxID=1137994 RepID=A0A239FVJ5_9ACTN|nr:prepilin peptidase [Geodermatophilus saharensis]SNS61017.1 leader peptidase (prepilin peptidase) / N-methyltransferase [Geodermatophilus saharensis]
MLPRGPLLALALLTAAVAGPLLARTAVRLAARDPAARTGPARALASAAVLAVLLCGAVLLTGARPATVALAWAAGAAVVLAQVDLAVHRLPDRVTYPAAGVAVAALLADAALLGTWPALLRALLAAAAAGGIALLAALAGPAGLGLGDVKLLALLGLLLGWAGWGVLLAGVFLGLLAGAAVSLLLVATGRAGWRTALPFGPPLLLGAVLALLLEGPVG